MTDRSTILRHLRKAKGWTQQKLANSIGVGDSQISRWESEAHADPDVASLVKLADSLECTTDVLLGRRSSDQ